MYCNINQLDCKSSHRLWCGKTQRRRKGYLAKGGKRGPSDVTEEGRGRTSCSTNTLALVVNTWRSRRRSTRKRETVGRMRGKRQRGMRAAGPLRCADKEEHTRTATGRMAAEGGPPADVTGLPRDVHWWPSEDTIGFVSESVLFERAGGSDAQRRWCWPSCPETGYQRSSLIRGRADSARRGIAVRAA